MVACCERRAPPVVLAQLGIVIRVLIDTLLVGTPVVPALGAMAL